VLVLIVLILFGVAVIALASVLVLRSRQAGEVHELGSGQGDEESRVYETLYGQRSLTVSAPMPIEPPPEADE